LADLTAVNLQLGTEQTSGTFGFFQTVITDGHREVYFQYSLYLKN